MFRKGGTAVLEKYFCVCFSLQRDTKRWLKKKTNKENKGQQLLTEVKDNHGGRQTRSELEFQ